MILIIVLPVSEQNGFTSEYCVYVLSMKYVSFVPIPYFSVCDTYHSQHAPAFFDCAATSQESDEKNETPNTDEDDSGVPNEGATIFKRLEHFNVVADVVVDEHPYSKTK